MITAPHYYERSPQHDSPASYDVVYRVLVPRLHAIGLEALPITRLLYGVALHNAYRTILDRSLLGDIFAALGEPNPCWDIVRDIQKAIGHSLSVADFPWLNETIKLALHPTGRKSHGSFYTPPDIAYRIAALLRQSLSNDPQRILDPAVGGGIFLVSLLKQLCVQDQADGFIVASRLFGFDVDPTAIVAARASVAYAATTLSKHASAERLLRHLHETAANFQVTDALFSEWGHPDVVISNPPYLRVRSLKNNHPDLAARIMTKFSSATRAWDLYMPFLEQGLREMREGGTMAMLVPIQFLHQDNATAIREILLASGDVRHLVDMSDGKRFAQALVKTCSVVVSKRHVPSASISAWAHAGQSLHFLGSLSNDEARRSPRFSLKLTRFTPERVVLDAMRQHSRALGDLCYVTFGLRSCAPGKGQGGKDRLICDKPLNDACRPYLEGREITRYNRPQHTRWINYLPHDMYSPRTPALFEAKKIISRTMLSTKDLVATLDDAGHYVEQSLACIIPHGIVTPRRTDIPDYPLEYILACINSSHQSRWFAGAVVDDSLGGGLIHATPGSQRQLLIPNCTDEDASDIASDVVTLLDNNNPDQTNAIVARIETKLAFLFGVNNDDPISYLRG